MSDLEHLAVRYNNILKLGHLFYDGQLIALEGCQSLEEARERARLFVGALKEQRATDAPEDFQD